MYEYKAKVLKVVDGDTMHLQVDLGLDASMKITVRLWGINTPEMSKIEGQTAKAYVEEWLNIEAPDGVIKVQTIKDRKEKYGRYLAIISSTLGGIDLNKVLLNKGFAEVYFP